jgi:transglutaminase-like putative cysteine protease
MIMRLTITLVLVCSIFTLRAKDEPRYPVRTIPESLKKDAYAVVRDDEMVFTIRSRNNATLHVHFAVTILNANGKHFATKAVSYDKLTKITSLKAQAYDANGELIKKLKNSEIADQSAFEGLYSDNRAKVAELTQGQYPYTVEFEYDVEYKFLFFIEGSAINQYEDVAVESASYQLIFPDDLKPRYKTFNVSQEPKEEKINNMTSLTWSFKDIQAQKFEVYSDKKNAIIRIEAAPTTFEYDGYIGTMQTWNDFGKWVASINKGRNVLPEETKKKVKEITDNLNSPEEKIKVVYEYLQNKTRYVSIQLGIGSYQPFEASIVDKTGYGDCKALSNYMVSLLESIGIKGHYALIYGGYNYSGLDADFPSTQFNHAVVAVPNGVDTIWLECTSQTNPFGYQGLFTGDRKALVITDNGATVVNTTRYPAEVNIQSTSADVTLGSTGDAKATIRATYSGLQYENGSLDEFITRQFEDQKKWLQRNIAVPSFDITSFNMKNVKNKIPSAMVTAELTMNRYASVSGKRIFLMPNLMNRNNHIPVKVENRKTKVVQKMSFIDFDTIRFHLPEDIYPEFLPADVKINNRFGEYEANFRVDQGSLVYMRKVKMNKGEFPAESYNELIEFFRSINKADNIKMVFINKT